jgi:hypothetical protein
MVPSEDYSHAPPCLVVFFVKGERPIPNRRAQKKTMKTNTDQKTKAGLLNRSEPLSPANRKPINFIRRQMNRSPDTGKLLSLLKADAPTFFELAEVVGKWVWVQFAKKQPARITRLLAELGFHWNSSRQARQHPCGLFRDKALPSDPRQKYGSYFPADVRPNLRPL